MVDTVEQNTISVHDLKFQYSKSDTALCCHHWSVQAASQIFLYGDSGSGKSTLLNLLSGILKPTSGAIELAGVDISALSANKLDRFRAQNIGVVFQQFNLIPYLNVIQNVQLAEYFAKRTPSNPKALEPMLDSLNLATSILNQKVSNLSVGQKQRVAIMRALINSPKLLLVDEPTSALDASARDGFMQLLLSITEAKQTTLIFVSHDTALRQHFTKHIAVTDICQWRTLKGETVC